MLDEGLNAIRDLISATMEKGQLGTGGTAPTSADTDLETADATTIGTLDITTADKQINTSFILPSTSGTSTTYKEYKNFDQTNSKDYDRIVFTGISFITNGTFDINVAKRYFISGA